MYILRFITQHVLRICALGAVALVASILLLPSMQAEASTEIDTFPAVPPVPTALPVGEVLGAYTSTTQVASLQAKIDELLKLVATLEEQVQARTHIGTAQIVSSETAAQHSSTNAPSHTGAADWCLVLEKNMRLGSRDTTSQGEVSKLQQFLKDTGYFTYPEITGYYGPATVTAVKRWQSAQGVVTSGDAESTGFGVIGPKTRGAFSQWCDAPDVVRPPQTPKQCPTIARVCADGSTARVDSNCKHHCPGDESREADETPVVAACTRDAKVCPDGTKVGRTGPNCEFVCPTAPVTCALDDAKQCPDGTYVSRTGPNCEFVCPGSDEPGNESKVCPMDAKVCPDGTTVGRTGPHCEFVCPSDASKQCPTIARVCADGSTARVDSNCKHHCPEDTEPPQVQPMPMPVSDAPVWSAGGRPGSL